MICRGVDPVDVVMVVSSGVFDREWYVSQNPDVAQSGSDPFEHFMTQGWIEGRSPSTQFDTQWYSNRYGLSDCISGNPLLHFLHVGWQQGYRPSPAFDPISFVQHHPVLMRMHVPPIVYARVLAANS